MQAPLSIAIAALLDRDRVLLVRKKKGEHIGLLGLPASKILFGETLAMVTTKTLQEDVSLESTFHAFLGLVSQHLLEGNDDKGHFMLFVCTLSPHSTTLPEFVEAEWCTFKEIEKLKDIIVPNDYFIIKHFLFEQKKTFYECFIEIVNGFHILKSFE